MRRSKILIVLALLMVGLTSPVSAVPAFGPGGPPQAQQLTGWLGSFLRAVWEKVGLEIDPFGGSQNQSPPPVEGTSGSDSKSTVWAEVGCKIDPWGGCSTGDGETDPPEMGTSGSGSGW